MIGGFLADSTSEGWRWVMGLLGIYAALLTAVAFVTMPETHAPTLLRRRAKLLSKVTGNTYMIQADVKNPVVISELIKRSLFRPWVLLFREPIVLSLTVWF
jgi:MFS family permease